MNLCLKQYEKPKRDAMIKAAVKHAYSNESEWERLRDLNCHAVESLEQLMRDQATEEEDSEGGDATNDGSDDDDNETIWMRGEERTRFDAPKLMPKCLRSRWGRSGRAAKSVQEFWPVWHAVFEGILGSESSDHLVCTYANEAPRLMGLYPPTNPTPDGTENDTNSSNATGTDGDDSNASKKPVPSVGWPYHRLQAQVEGTPRRALGRAYCQTH